MFVTIVIIVTFNLIAAILDLNPFLSHLSFYNGLIYYIVKLSGVGKIALAVLLWQYLSIRDYFTSEAYIGLSDVIVPSTMLTSLWTFLCIISIGITMLLMPVERLRRFTAWWFRDIEKRPLTALAKVAGTLIIIGAVAIRGVRWLTA